LGIRIANLSEGQTELIKAVGKVIHNGKSTMVAEGEIVDGQNQLIAKARAAFFVTGTFKDGI
jgi:1,4-dihydroxy-2-naphthoyl-CoA hydrolase